MFEWLAIFAAAAYAVLKLYSRGRRTADMPPGPPTVPLLGNLPLMSKGATFVQFTAWARQYGDIYSIMGGPTGTIVVLSSPGAIFEVLETQGALTVERPRKVVVDHITGGLTIGLSQYNAYWKATRKAAHEVLKPSACAKHLPIQKAESAQLLFDIMNSPADTHAHIQRYTFSVMLSVMYGQRTPQNSSLLMRDVFDITQRMAKIMAPTGAPPLEMFPFLKYVPERWAPWKTTCKTIRRDQRNLFFGLLENVEKRISRGEENGSYIETVLGMGEALKLNREEICYFGFSMLGGGTSSSTAWIHFLVLCMAVYPESQKKAQEELDRVIGNERAPEIGDLESLPYVQAVIREVTRFRVVIPMTLPHVCTSDVMYKGYRIPAGSSIFANIWGVMHDEALFEEPEMFNPDRFLESPSGVRKGAPVEHEEAMKRLNLLPWGSGRRSCPGTNLASQTIAIIALNLLWAFEFRKARDADGKEIPVDLWAFTKGATTDVLPFVINPRVRDPVREGVIRRNFMQSSEVFEKFERELDDAVRQQVVRTRMG